MAPAPSAAYYDGLTKDGGAVEAPDAPVELKSKQALKARKRAVREGRLSRPPRSELEAPPPVESDDSPRQEAPAEDPPAED